MNAYVTVRLGQTNIRRFDVIVNDETELEFLIGYVESIADKLDKRLKEFKE